MKSKLTILLSCFIFPFILLAQNQTTLYQTLLIPFKNSSGFKNQWQLEKSIPEYYASRLDSLPNFQRIDLDSLGLSSREKSLLSSASPPQELLEKLATAGVDLLISGKLQNFELNKIRIGNPLIFGVGSFRCYLKLTVYLHQPGSDNKPGSFRVEVVRQNRNLMFTPQGMTRRKYLSFSDLDTVQFGTPSFFRTIVGRVINDSYIQFWSKLSTRLGIIAESAPVPDDFLLRARVMSKVGDRIHLNVGASEGIISGQHFLFYLQNQQHRSILSGELEIIQVKDSHLSLARILDKSSLEVRTGDEIILNPR